MEIVMVVWVRKKLSIKYNFVMLIVTTTDIWIEKNFQKSKVNQRFFLSEIRRRNEEKHRLNFEDSTKFDQYDTNQDSLVHAREYAIGEAKERTGKTNIFDVSFYSIFESFLEN